MSFAQAFQRAVTQKGNEANITIPDINNSDTNNWEPTDLNQVPMMYRAQVQGRCSLQYGKNNTDLEEWTEQWIYPNPNNHQTPFYQYSEVKLGREGSIYRIQVEFPFRVFTNCGQDSILRPTLGKNGIPFIPGSSIKGLFKRLPNFDKSLAQEIIEDYCGSQEKQGTLRFHGAYPVGDWAGTKEVKSDNNPEKTRYLIVDVVHPQQNRQVEGKGSPKAIAIISFYQPTFVFEFSSIKDLSEEDWKNFERRFKLALRLGLGGKTSTGYGLYTSPQDESLYPIWVDLKGKGVSPLLRSDEPEFRPNLFKASLQGHVRRLLAGVSNRKDDVDQVVNRLFGCTTEPGSLQLYWQSQSIDVSQTIGQENTPIYQAKGTLYLDVKNKKDRHFMENVLKFAFTMGGFGKSWRRVWHQDFFPNYKTRAIGCHWEWLDSDLKKLEIQSSDEFKKFLNHLHKETQQYLGISKPQSLSWKEAWNPERLTVYSQVVDRSQAIRLFHNEQFKTTPAIGGRQPGDQRPTFFSCVWHRMLPIEQNKYLEIVTLFHGGQSKNLTDQWIRKANGNNENQLPVFVKQLENQGFQKTWGSYPPKS